MNGPTRTESEQSWAEQLRAQIACSPFDRLDVVRNFPMYCPRQDLTRFLSKAELFKRVLDVQGSVVECGCLHGGGLFTWAQLSSIFEPYNHQRRIVGFDSFEGFPDTSPMDDLGAGADNPLNERGALAVDSYAEIKACAKLYDANRAIGHVPKIELVKGDACRTIPEYVRANPHLVVSLLYLDFDLHEPTAIALRTLSSRMPKGAIVAFDELNAPEWPGETIAALPYLKKLRVRRLPWGSTLCWAKVE
jgi:hypothetical protein